MYRKAIHDTCKKSSWVRLERPVETIFLHGVPRRDNIEVPDSHASSSTNRVVFKNTLVDFLVQQYLLCHVWSGWPSDETFYDPVVDMNRVD